MRKVLAGVLAVATQAVSASDVDMSGFMSVGVGIVDDESVASYAGYRWEDASFDPDTLFGLQVKSDIDERLSVTAQVIARGDGDYDANIEWAYVSYAATEQLLVRAGRLRTPLYLFSDFVDVGYAYHWLRAPVDVYDFPFNNFTGVDAVYQCSLGSFECVVQGYFGASSFEIDGPTGDRVPAEVNDQMGLALTLSRDWFSFRTAYHVGKVDIALADLPDMAFLINALEGNGFNRQAGQLRVEQEDGYFGQLGVTIDNGRFVAVAEQIELEIDDAPLPAYERKYLMVGVRLGDVLLHVTGAQTRDDAQELAAGIPVGPGTAPLIGGLNRIATGFSVDSDTTSVGLRWDFTSSATFKLQLDDVQRDNGDDQTLFSMAIQTVF